jgi:DNA repair exonuclease SbcCD ATPase subunit
MYAEPKQIAQEHNHADLSVLSSTRSRIDFVPLPNDKPISLSKSPKEQMSGQPSKSNEKTSREPEPTRESVIQPLIPLSPLPVVTSPKVILPIHTKQKQMPLNGTDVKTKKRSKKIEGLGTSGSACEVEKTKAKNTQSFKFQELIDVMSQFQSSFVQVVKRLETQYINQQHEFETLRNKQQHELKHLNEKFDRVVAENETLSKRIKKLTEELKKLLAKNAELVAENRKLVENNNELQRSLEESKKVHATLQQTIDELRTAKEEETTKLMKEMERIVEEKSSKVEENLKFLAGNLDGLSIEELKSLELEIREIHQNIQKTIDKKEAEERLCVICMENPKMMAFSTCGHRCVCEECVKGMAECPMCRQKGMPIKIFM